MYYLIKSWIKEKVKKDTLLWVILKYTEIIINPKKLYQYIKIEIFKNSIFTFGDELCMASLFRKKILDKTIELFSPKSVLDLGC